MKFEFDPFQILHISKRGAQNTQICFAQIPFSAKMVPNVVIQNYPDLSEEMKTGHKQPLFGKSYVIQNHFWVNFGTKRTKIDPIFVHFGSYWMLISMVKMILVNFLHEDGHKNQMMAISCLKTSFLGSKNQLFSNFEFFLFFYKIFFVVA